MQPASCTTSTTVYPSRSIIHSDPKQPGISAPSGAGDVAQSDARPEEIITGDSGQKQYVLLLQLCDGDLNATIHKSNSWRVKWRYALEMAKGLAYIHAQGQAHLDIKPGNIFLRKRQKKDDEAHADVPYQVHVGDFGMDSSKSIDENECKQMSVDELRWRLDKWCSQLDGNREELTEKILDRGKQKGTDQITISEQPIWPLPA
eukprot:COSAG06_NODE_9729_length_1831_cov_20.887047_2_plen_203_part_00